MDTSSIRVLHVDDDPTLLELTGEFLEREDDRLVVETATSAGEGLDQIGDRPPDCIVSDYDMPGNNGIEFLQSVRDKWSDLPFILFTGKGSESVASDAIAAGVTDYLQKGSGTEQYELLANRITNAVEARQSVEQFRAEQEFSEQALDALDDLFYVLDMDGTIRRYNEQFVAVTGYGPTKLDGLAATELFAEDERQTIADAIETTLQDGEVTVEADLLTAGGRRIPYEFTGARLTDTDGNVTGLVGVGRNLTERRQREQRFQQIMKTMPGCVVELDAEGEFVFANERAEEVLGLDSEGVTGRTYNDPNWDLRDPSGGPIPDESLPFSQIRDTGKAVYDEQLDIAWPDGTRKLLLVNGAPFFGEDGSFKGAIFSLVDITDREERRRELARTKALMSKMEQLADIGAWEYDPETGEVTNTAGTKRVHGIDMSTSLTLEEAFESFHPADRDRLRDRFNACVETGESYEIDVRLTTSDGGQRWVTARGERVTTDRNGSVVRGYMQDITDRKKRERELNREQERYATLFETLPTPVLHARIEDSEPIVKTVNPAFEDTFGYDTETIQDELLHKYVLPDDQADAAQQLTRRILREGDVQTEVQRKTADGVRTFRLNVGTSDIDGESGYGYAVYTDVTDQKQLEHDLRQERDLIEGIIETTPVGIAVVTPDGELSFVNDRAERIYGRSRDEIEQMSHNDPRWDLVNERGDPIEAGDAPFNRVVSQKNPVRDQIVGICRPSGERVWLSVSGAPQYGDDSELERAVFAVEDITEQRQLEAELSEILGRVSDAFYALDSEFQFTHVNGRAEELLGVSEDELLDETVWDMYPEAAETDKIWDTFHIAMETQDPQDLELYYEPLDLWLEASVYPSESGISVYFRDVTEQKEYERELEAQNERLEEFTSVVSHDLRNPLQVAKSRTGLAQTECDSSHLDDVADAIDRSQALIEDLLTLAQEGEEVSEVEPVALADVAERSWQTVESRSATLETHATRTFQADRSRVKQLFENLYRNAIEHGGDDVTVSVGSMASGFYLADTGPGISEGDREKIFEAGYSTAEEGTGFGLRIVEQVVEAHGWDIRVADSDDDGARFEITGVDTPDKEIPPDSD